MHLMYGTEPRQHFDRFNIDVNYIVGKILAKVKVDVMKLSPVDGRKLEDVKLEDILPKCGEYFINCCLMPAIKKLSAADGRLKKAEFDDSRVVEGIVDGEELEMKFVKDVMPVLLECSSEVTSNKPYFIIRQVALRSFWQSKIHPKLYISPKRFAAIVQASLASHGASTGLSIDLANTFLDAISCDQNEANNIRSIDAFAVAKIGRMLPLQEYSFVEVVKMIADSSDDSHSYQNLTQFNQIDTVNTLLLCQ